MTEPLILRLENHSWQVPEDFVQHGRDASGKRFCVEKWFRDWCRDNFTHEYRFEWCGGKEGYETIDRGTWWMLHLTSHDDWLLLTMKWQ